MSRIVTYFRREDFGVKTHVNAPHIVNRATAAFARDSYSDAPRGIIFVPACWSPKDFLLFGRTVVNDYYIPDAWLEAV